MDERFVTSPVVAESRSLSVATGLRDFAEVEAMAAFESELEEADPFDLGSLAFGLGAGSFAGFGGGDGDGGTTG